MLMRLIPVSREFLCKPAVSVQSDRIERLIFGVDSVDRVDGDDLPNGISSHVASAHHPTHSARGGLMYSSPPRTQARSRDVPQKRLGPQGMRPARAPV